MDYFALVRDRQSVRAYQQKEVEAEKLERIIEAVRSAPSAGNYQSYEVYVVRGRERIDALTKSTFDQKFIAQAPVALVFCTNAARCQYEPREYFALQDTSIATTFAMLAIKALGLETCWVGAFKPDTLAAAMGIQPGHVPVAVLPVGYGAEVPERTTRRPNAEFVHEL